MDDFRFWGIVALLEFGIVIVVLAFLAYLLAMFQLGSFLFTTLTGGG